MDLKLNKEYYLRVIQISGYQSVEAEKISRKMVKRVKIVAFPFENEAVIEFIGAKRYYEGVGLPVRGRLYITAGVPSHLSSGDEKYEVMNILG